MANHGEQSPRQVLLTKHARARASQTRDPGLAGADHGHCPDSGRFAGRIVMGLFKRITAGVRGLFPKTQLEEGLDAELVEFLERSVEEKIRAGLNRAHTTRAGSVDL